MSADAVMRVIMNICDKQVTLTDSFNDLEVDSIMFIRIVVELESELEIEFEDEALIIENYETVNDFICYVDKLVSNYSIKT